MHPRIDDEYLDVLQNIESAIVQEYRDQPELLDYDVEEALEELISKYRAISANRTYTHKRLSERAEKLFVELEPVCEWRIGNAYLEDSKGREVKGPEPITAEEMVACLRKIKKSVGKWTRERGRQGYLNFVKHFFG